MKKLTVKKADHKYWDVERKIQTGMTQAKACESVGRSVTAYQLWKKSRKPFLVTASTQETKPTLTKTDEIALLAREIATLTAKASASRDRLKTLVQEI